MIIDDITTMGSTKDLVLRRQRHNVAGLPPGKATLTLSGHRVEKSFRLAQSLDEPDEIKLVLDLVPGHQDDLE